MEKIIVVLAGSHSQFLNFIQNEAKDDVIYKYISRPNQAMGLEIDSVIEIGTFRRLENSYKLRKLVESRIR